MSIIISVPGCVKPNSDRSIFWYSFPERGRRVDVDVDGRFNLKFGTTESHVIRLFNLRPFPSINSHLAASGTSAELWLDMETLSM